MKIQFCALITFLLCGTIGCYATITGKVVDSETGEPIEGAVVLVEWTKTKGFGLTYTESYKVIEAVTDKEGLATVSGVFNPMVNPPDITIYKKSYVAWNNKFIFPNYEKRKDFKWQSGYVFKLERFKPEYTYREHWDFITDVIHSGMALGKKDLIKSAIAWEEDKAFEEKKKGTR